MDHWQREIIEDNLDELISKTRCNTILLAKFRAKGILSKDEGDDLSRNDMVESEKSNKLLDILVTRVGSFSILIDCLKATKQSGALQILTHRQPDFITTGRITYDNNQLVGEGSSGMVFHGKFGERPVAVKVMHVSQAKCAQREIKLLERLDSHENIVRYFATETEKKYIYIALELCSTTLEVAVKSNLPDLHAAEMLKQCTKGLAFLHDNNVIHCDLKPSNILLTESRDVKISDFGLAKNIPKERRSVTTYTGVKGTVDWMAPELMEQLFAGKQKEFKMTVASDVFSLGCVYFFMLSRGSHPFGKPVERQNNIYYNKSSTKNNSICMPWLEIIEKMISYDASNRPTTAVVLDLLRAASKLHCTTCVYRSNHYGPQNSNSLQLGTTAKSIPEDTSSVLQDKTSTISSELEKVITSLAINDIPQTQPLCGGKRRNSPNSSSTAVEENSRPDSTTEELEKNCTETQKDCVNYAGFKTDNATRTSTGTASVQNNFPTTESTNGCNSKNKHDCTSLQQALYAGMSKEVIEVIVSKGKEDWKTITEYGVPMLHRAAMTSHFEALKYFVELGADVNLKDTSNNTPLHRLDFDGKHWMTVLNILLEAGADINAKNLAGATLLNNALYTGASMDKIQYIVSKGGDFKTKTDEGKSMLHMASTLGKLELIKYFTKLGVGVNWKDKKGDMPIHCLEYHLATANDVVKTLLECGASINAKGWHDFTPLLLGVWKGMSLDKLKEIVSLGGDYKALNADGSSVLHLAPANPNIEIIKFFVDLGVDINLRNKFGDMPINRIEFSDSNKVSRKVLDKLLEYGAAINAKGWNDTTLLLNASRRASVGDLQYLVYRGGDWKAKDKDGKSVLHFATQYGHIEAIKYFAKLGADINLKDRGGYMPIDNLRFIYQKPLKKDVLKTLIECGADINAVDCNGSTPFLLAVQVGMSRRELIKIGGNWKAIKFNGQSALHLAAGCDAATSEVVKYIIDLGADINLKDKEGNMPIHKVQYKQENAKDVLRTLIECGADINAKGKNGLTPKALALRNGISSGNFQSIVNGN